MATANLLTDDATWFTTSAGPCRYVDSTVFSSAEDCGRAWHELIERRLNEWERHPEAIEEEEVVPPGEAAISAAIRLGARLAAKGMPVPRRLSPDGDGGIVFEWWDGDSSWEIRIGEDLAVEWAVFHGAQLIATGPLEV